jgi:glutaredoxin-related protein
MAESPKLLLEVIYKADYCIPCVYMDEAVREVLPQYPEVDYRKVAFMESTEHKKRFTELSISLHGKEKVYRMEQLAPIPSIFIDGKLVFDLIPPRFELEAAIEQALLDKGHTFRH